MTSQFELPFQLPYWLHPLEAGSYGRFVRDLIEADLPAEATSGRGPEATERRKVGQGSTSRRSPTDPDSPAADDEIEATIRDMTLDADELEFLASPALAGIAPREPRSVKHLPGPCVGVLTRRGAGPPGRSERAAGLPRPRDPSRA